MSSDTLDPTDGTRRGITAGTIALVGVVLLLVAIGAAVVLEMRGGASGDPAGHVTIAELRADPDGFDARSVQLRVTVEDVRRLPLLDQYALYNVRDTTGSMRVLSSNGVPRVATDGSETVELQATFHSRITLDEQIRRLVQDQLGTIAGFAVDTLVPGIPLDVIYLEHERYTLPDGTPEP